MQRRRRRVTLEKDSLEWRSLMSAVRLLAWLVLPLVALVLLGMLAIWVVHAILGLLGYLVVGALIVGGGLYLYRRAKRSIGGTGTRRRIGS
jgi:hypothetical protein